MGEYLKEDSVEILTNTTKGVNVITATPTFTSIGSSTVFNNENNYSADTMKATIVPSENIQSNITPQSTEPSETTPFEQLQEITVKKFRLKKN